MPIYPVVQGSDRMVLTDTRGSGRIEAIRAGVDASVVFTSGSTRARYTADVSFFDLDPANYGTCRALVREAGRSGLLR